MTNQDLEYFSEEGLKQLQEELQDLKTKKRRDIADRLEYAKSLGDLSENSEYQEAKEAQLLNEAKVAELEDMLRRAVIVHKSTSKNTVEIGSKIIVEQVEPRGSELTFSIVGSKEASPLDNKISNESPLGAALLGHKKSEIVKVLTPKGIVEYKIVDIV